MAASFDIIAKLRADATEFVKGMKEGEIASSSFAKNLGGVGNALAVGIAASVAVAGVALYKIGENFDEALDSIRVSTGQTGVALGELEDSFREVFAATPSSMKDVSDVISALNVELGLTGKPLEELSTQLLNLSRITDTEVKANTEALTTVFKNFGVSAEEQKDKLDLLFRASQTSGVSVQELAGKMGKAGLVLRAVGMDFDSSAAFLGMLAKAGVDVGDAIPAMTRALSNAAKNGKDSSVVFKETFQAISDATGKVEADGIALEVFGGRAGPKLAALIREGKLSYEDYMLAIQNGSDTINGAAAETDDFAENLRVMGNKIQLALEPLATYVFAGMAQAMKLLTPVLTSTIGFMKTLVETFLALPGPIKMLVPVVTGLILAMKGFMVIQGIMLALKTSVLLSMSSMAAAAGTFVMNFIAMMPGMAGAATVAGLTIQAAFWPIVAVALAAFAAFMLFTQSSRDSAKAQKEYKDTLDKTTGAITQQSKELTTQKLQQSGALDAMNKTGIKLEQITGFIQEHNAERIKQGKLEGMVRQQLEMSNVSEEQAAILRAKHVQQLRDMGGANNELLASLMESGALSMTTINTLYDEADAYGKKQEELEAANVAQQTSNGLVGEAAKQAAAATQANQAQAKSIQDIMDKNLAATNPLFAALAAQRDANDAQATLNQLRKEGKQGSDEYNKALEDSIKAGLSYADALTKMDVAQLKGETSAEKFQSAMKMLTDIGLKPTDADMASLQARIEALYGPMNALKEPSQAYTDILNKMKTDGMDPAKLAAGKYSEQLQALAATLSPDDPLRKNIEATVIELFLLGLQKPSVTVQVETTEAQRKVRDLLNLVNDLTGEYGQGLGFKKIPGKAVGGPVTAGNPYIVGERGPELFMPSSSGTIIPNHAMASAASSGSALMAAGGTTINVAIEVGATADKASVGKAVVEAISAFERRSGSGWRS